MPEAERQSAVWLGADAASFKKQIKLKYAHIFSTDQTVELWQNTHAHTHTHTHTIAQHTHTAVAAAATFPRIKLPCSS